MIKPKCLLQIFDLFQRILKYSLKIFQKQIQDREISWKIFV